MLSAPSPDDDESSPSFRDPRSSTSLPSLPSIDDLVSYIPMDQDEIVVTLTVKVSKKNGVHVFPPVISSSDSDTASLPSFKQCIKPPVREQNPASQSDVATRNNNGESADSTLTSSVTSVEKPLAQPLSKDDALKARLAALQKLMKRKRENAAISSAMNTDDNKLSSSSTNFSTGTGNYDETDSLVSKKMKLADDNADDTAFVKSSDVVGNQNPMLSSSVDNGPNHQAQFAESCSSSMRTRSNETVQREPKQNSAAPLPTGPIVISPSSTEVDAYIQTGDVSECRDACRIWVGNLPSTCAISQLRRFFEPFGQVKDAIIIKDKETQQSKGFGFVEFMDVNSADRALERNGELQMSNRLIRIGKAVRPGTVIAPPTSTSSTSSISSDSKSATVFISGLTSDVTSALIIDAFRKCGEIADIRIIQDRSTRKSKGYAFIEFIDPSSANAAMKASGSIFIHGKPIEVKVANEPKPSQPQLTIVASNLPSYYDRSAIERLFAKYGNIKKICIPDRLNDNGTRTVFVLYETMNAASRAVEKLNNTKTAGAYLRLEYDSKDPGELLRLYLEKCEVEQSANEEKTETTTNSRFDHPSHSSSLPLSPPARRGNLSNSNIDSYDPSAPSINFGPMDRTNSFPQMWPEAMSSLLNSAASVSSLSSQTSKPVSITPDTSVMNALNMSSGSSHVPSTLGTQHLGLNNLSNLSYYQQLIQSLYRPTSNLQTPGPRESAPTPPTVAPNQNVSLNVANGQTTSSNAFPTPSMLPFMGLGFNLGMPSLGMNNLPMSMNLPMNMSVPGMNGMNKTAMGLGMPGMNVMGMGIPGASSGLFNPTAFMSNGVGPGQGQNQQQIGGHKSGNIDGVERS